MNSVLDTPTHRSSSRAFSSSPLHSSEAPAPVSRAAASQAAAFAEVDRAILARKVGIPTKKGELVPSPFPNLSKATGKLDHESNVTGDTGTSEGTGSVSGYETAGSNIESVDGEEEEGKRGGGKDGKDRGEEGGEDKDKDKDKEDEDEGGDGREEEVGDEGEERLVTVSHALTNVIVLQEFLLELAALVQVRAGLFGEVRFT
jgi:hypothetical protein